MNARLLLSALTLAAMLLPISVAHAKAQQRRPSSQSRPMRLAQAEPMTMETRTVERNESKPHRSKNGLALKLGLAGGLSMTSTQASAAGAVSDSSFANNLYVGLMADGRMYRFFGFEVDGYMGLNSSNVSSTGETIAQKSHGLQLSVKSQVSFGGHGVRYRPKIGFGYGFARLEDSATSGSSTSTDTASLSGGHFLLGMEIEMGRNILFSLDFSKTIFAGGSITRGGVPPVTDASATSASLDRIRAGAYYRFAPHFLGGLQYIRRGYRFEIPVAGVPVTESSGLNQFLATFVYEL